MDGGESVGCGADQGECVAVSFMDGFVWGHGVAGGSGLL